MEWLQVQATDWRRDLHLALPWPSLLQSKVFPTVRYLLFVLPGPIKTPRDLDSYGADMLLKTVVSKLMNSVSTITQVMKRFGCKDAKGLTYNVHCISYTWISTRQRRFIKHHFTLAACAVRWNRLQLPFGTFFRRGSLVSSWVSLSNIIGKECVSSVWISTLDTEDNT